MKSVRWLYALIAVLSLTGLSACDLRRLPTKPKPKTTKKTKPTPTPKPTPTTRPTGTSTSPVPVPGTAVALGTGVFPAGTPETGATIHTWTAPIQPSSYELGYALAPTEKAALAQAFQAYARSVGLQEDSKDRFKWRPPPQCAGDLHCPYQNIAGRGSADLEPVIERFRARQRAASLSAGDLAALIVTFVQDIRYEIPKDSPFGILPPPLVVAESRGDCDSKSLLALMLLRAFGIDSVVLSSDAHRHAILAIALPANGAKVTYAGRQYALTEMTASGSPIGHINSSLLRPNDWRVIPVQYVNAAASPPKPKPPPRPTR